jgi:hypothetical protein
MPEYVTQSTGTEILPDGSEWPFVVEDAREKESQAGNPMIELQLRLFNGSNKGPLIYDNLVFVEKAYWKLDHFRQATGEKLIPGQKVVFNADDCIDRSGRLVVMIDNYGGRARNKVDHYVLPNESSSGLSQVTPTKPLAVPKNELGEPLDIPF